MNAMKHGLDAQTTVLPGEDEAAFRARLDAWRADIKPRNAEEEALLEQAARLSWQLDRADRVQAEVLSERIRQALSGETRRQQEEADAAEAAEVGRRLLDGPPAPQFKIDKIAKRLARMYASPFWSQYTPLVDINRLRGKRLVMPRHPDDPGHPQRLLRQLESTAAGCRWLLDRWAELRRSLEANPCWTADQRLAAVRLLGREPVDAIDDPMVQSIYLCSFVLDPAGPRVLTDQAVETTRREFEAFLQLLADHGARDRVPRSREIARAQLLDLVDGIITRLEVLQAARAERSEAAPTPDRLAFDDTAQGERIRRVQGRLRGSFHRTIDRLMKVRRRPDAASPTPEPARNCSANPDRERDCEKMRNEPNAGVRPAAVEATVRPPAGCPTAGPSPSAGGRDTSRPRWDADFADRTESSSAFEALRGMTRLPDVRPSASGPRCSWSPTSRPPPP